MIWIVFGCLFIVFGLLYIPVVLDLKDASMISDKTAARLLLATPIWPLVVVGALLFVLLPNGLMALGILVRELLVEAELAPKKKKPDYNKITELENFNQMVNDLINDKEMLRIEIDSLQQEIDEAKSKRKGLFR